MSVQEEEIYIQGTDLARLNELRYSTIKFYSEIGILPFKQANKKLKKFYPTIAASNRIKEIQKLKKTLTIEQIKKYYKAKNILNNKSMAKIISIVLRKGGIGKTTTAINLATALQLMGKKTLLIDLDPQSNATISVGINPLELTQSINTLFTNIDVTPREVIIETAFGLSIIPATEDLKKTEAGMTASQVGALKPILNTLKDEFEYIIIDTPPSATYLSINALVASRYVLIPLQAHYLAMQALSQTMEDIKQVKNGLNSKLEIIGILPTMVNTNTNIARTVLENVKTSYPELFLSMDIKYSVKHSEASLVGQPIVIYAPTSDGAQEYIKLAKYVDGERFA